MLIPLNSLVWDNKFLLSCSFLLEIIQMFCYGPGLQVISFFWCVWTTHMHLSLNASDYWARDFEIASYVDASLVTASVDVSGYPWVGLPSLMFHHKKPRQLS